MHIGRFLISQPQKVSNAPKTDFNDGVYDIPPKYDQT